MIKENIANKNRKCMTCKYLSKEEKWSVNAQCIFIYSCKKKMINLEEDISIVKLNTTSCGYYMERIENEQLSLFM